MIGVDDLQQMAADPIVFAMANPTPEIMPEQAEPYVAVMATGRSDYPNQINNVLCFPGIFRGALDARASCINEEMKLAAAHAIAAAIGPDELHAEYIVPSVFDKRIAEAVARAVGEAAHLTGVARRGMRDERFTEGTRLGSKIMKFFLVVSHRDTSVRIVVSSTLSHRISRRIHDDEGARAHHSCGHALRT